MPEDLPRAVLVLLWLLIGVIVFGYLAMEYPLVFAFVFAAVFYGGPVLWNVKFKK
ncbi:MAG: hypothetical protein GXP09_11375 [Gammaproteobacteria bacterium]|nr:hypothetical protein [Gammaproteobacteria bacterium]